MLSFDDILQFIPESKDSANSILSEDLANFRAKIEKPTETLQTDTQFNSEFLEDLEKSESVQTKTDSLLGPLKDINSNLIKIGAKLGSEKVGAPVLQPSSIDQRQFFEAPSSQSIANSVASSIESFLTTSKIDSQSNFTESNSFNNEVNNLSTNLQAKTEINSDFNTNNAGDQEILNLFSKYINTEGGQNRIKTAIQNNSLSLNSTSLGETVNDISSSDETIDNSTIKNLVETTTVNSSNSIKESTATISNSIVNAINQGNERLFQIINRPDSVQASPGSSNNSSRETNIDSIIKENVPGESGGVASFKMIEHYLRQIALLLSSNTKSKDSW